MSTTPSKKTLGVFSLVMINVIAIDNLRSLPFSASFGTSLIGYYLIGALLFFMPIALITAELATHKPNSGGVYVWIREAFGETWGYLAIWVQWVYNIIWYPTILSFVAATLATIIDPHLAEHQAYIFYTIMALFWGATLLNCFGIQFSSKISTLGALLGTLLPMAFIVVLGGVWLYQGQPVAVDLSWSAAWPSITDAEHVVFLLAIAFGLVGIEMSGVHAPDVKNPTQAFPKAILISSVIIFASLILSSLSIALVIPAEQLNVITAMTQAFSEFLGHYQLEYLTPWMSGFIILGGIASVTTWIIGPTRGLYGAAKDGSAPQLLAHTNKHGVPVMILLLQALIFTALASLFLWMPTVKSSYWILTVMTTQLSLLVYLLLFAAAIKLRKKRPKSSTGYTIPGGVWGLKLACTVGFLTCLTIIGLGFVPPSQIDMGHIYTYELTLLGGMLLFCLPPGIKLIKQAIKKS